MMTVMQCWDDGVTTDVRLVDIFRRHGAKATFNLSDGLHAQYRSMSFVYEGVEVRRLGRYERRAVYEGFTIASHSLTHPRLDQMPVEAARREITEGRERLQQFFGQPVPGFAYPFGSYNDTVVTLVREAGHVYGRTDRNAEGPFPPENPLLFHPSCHFLAPDLWSRYASARESGVFYFWGHSYEMTTEAMWNAFEEMIRRVGADPDACWGDPADLFAGGNP